MGLLKLTSSAKEYLEDIRKDDYITLGVKGGGCSGFQYVWDFKKNVLSTAIRVRRYRRYFNRRQFHRRHVNREFL